MYIDHTALPIQLLLFNAFVNGQICRHNMTNRGLRKYKHECVKYKNTNKNMQKNTNTIYKSPACITQYTQTVSKHTEDNNWGFHDCLEEHDTNLHTYLHHF